MNSTTHCPLCGEPNECGEAAGKGVCWCRAAVVPEDLIARVPEELRGAVCVCEKCVQAHLEARTTGGSTGIPPKQDG